MIKMTKEIQKRIESAIKELKLTDDELEHVSCVTFDKITQKANVTDLQVMYYLRYFR